MSTQSHSPGHPPSPATAVEEKLTIIIPVYRESEELPQTLARIHEAMSKAPIPTAVLFVDDGSPDNSVEILLEHAEKNTYARVVALDGNHGQHTAVFAGIELARSSKVATMEAHPEHDVGDLFELYSKMDEGTDLVGGVRVGRTLPWWRTVGSWTLNRILVGLGVSPFHDLGCQLAVWRREVAHEAFYMAARLPWHQGLGHLLSALRGRQAKNHRVQCRYTSDRPSAYHAPALFKGAFLVLWTAFRLRLGASVDLSLTQTSPYRVASDSATASSENNAP